MNRYENDRLEHYMRRNNLRHVGLTDEKDESEEVIQVKKTELAADMGVTVKPRDTSTVHSLGRRRDRSRPVIVRFCHRKKRNEVMNKKKELKNNGRNTFVNED